MAGGAALVQTATDGAALDDTGLATLLLAADVPTGTLLDLARAARPAGFRFETFAPLYLTNECDAECRMCGMRRDNVALQRETAAEATIADSSTPATRPAQHGLDWQYRQGARRAP
jgi:2-iminoacetate synthase ThiH